MDRDNVQMFKENWQSHTDRQMDRQIDRFMYIWIDRRTYCKKKAFALKLHIICGNTIAYMNSKENLLFTNFMLYIFAKADSNLLSLYYGEGERINDTLSV